MGDDFPFDVFLSHSSKDKAIVHEIAIRLKADGLRVWLDDWEIRAGDSIPARLEHGLENSRVLVLCMSANAFGSDWSQLESGTFRFRDPLNQDRRFIPLRLDEAPIKGSLAQFLHLRWQADDQGDWYRELLEACRPPAKQPAAEAPPAETQAAKKAIQLEVKARVDAFAFSPNGKRVLTGAEDNTVQLWDVASGKCLRTFEGHSDHIWTVAWSSDQCRALSGSWDKTIRLWDVETGRCLRVMEGHSEAVWCVAWSADQKQALSSSADNTMRRWDIETGACLSVLVGHTSGVRCVAWGPEQVYAYSGSWDKAMRLWEVDSGRCLRVVEGHANDVLCLAWNSNNTRILSGSNDKTMRLWNAESGHCLCIYEGHTSDVNSIVWSADSRYAFSGSDDKTVRLWDVVSGACLKVFEGHAEGVKTVALSSDGRHGFSGDVNGVIRIWDLSEFAAGKTASVLTETVSTTAPEQVEYTNAKVLLVGESGVGKTGLANYLARGVAVADDRPLPSSDGAWATHWPMAHSTLENGLDREVWLWDFAGQVDYRLVQQLFMDETAAAVLVFNPQNENPFEGLGNWDRDLRKATRKPFAKLLAAGRIDRGSLVVSSESMARFMEERGFRPPLHLTSAKTGEGCKELREAIVNAIDWENIPETTSPVLYQRMKQEILQLRNGGLVLIRLSELKQRMEMTLRGEELKPGELEAVVSLLAGPGMIQRLDFGGFILLRPEVLSRYAAAVVRKVRLHPQEMGCIFEDEMLKGELDYQDFERLSREDEEVVLRTLLDTFVSRAWCLRQPCDGTALLTFPSYFRRERKQRPGHPNVLISYEFAGPTEDIYATLVVRLHHTVAFRSTDLWKSAADFQTQTGAALGFTLSRESEGNSRLEVYFSPDVDANSRVVFLRYVHDHLTEYAQNVVRLRHYFCPKHGCERPFTDNDLIQEALAEGGSAKIYCPRCRTAIPLRDTIEEKFESPFIREKARELKLEGQAFIDNESREMMAVHHIGFIVFEAGQIYRGFTNSDHGIDGEIEFKDDKGEATGQKLYVQVKSGESYLRTRQRDGAEVFEIKKPRWSKYWQSQGFPVMLVIRGADGEIRWMDVTEYLKRETQNGRRSVKQVIFKGEGLDVMSVRRWRDQVLGKQ